MESNISKKNLIKRIYTGLILVILVFYIITQGSNILLDFFLCIIFTSTMYEVILIVNKDRKKRTLIARLIWIIITMIYIGIAIYCFKSVINSKSFPYPTFLLLSIWIFDTSAYFVGSFIGGPKLCSRISPKKTWSGLLGGMITTFLFPIIYFLNDNSKSISYLIKYGLIATSSGLVGQFGDLLESWFKRKFGVKDSGSILPGHGGILDRLDSMLLASFHWYILSYTQ